MAARDQQTEASSFARKVATAYRRVRAFFTSELWETSVDTLPPGKARRYRLLRVAATVVDGLFLGDTLPLHAAALTYYTVLSLVPLLAFLFSILKGFGAYDALVEETLRPYLLEATSANPALREAFERVLDFVSQTGVASLGSVGLILALYSAVRLLRNVEMALNSLWGAPDGRPFTEQMKNYTAILVVTPLSLLLATGLATTAQLVDAVAYLRERLGLGGVVDGVLRLGGPALVVLFGLFFLYLLMPNANVRARSALLGAAVGGALWYVFLILHVRFQLGVARYNALYSSFAAVPIFLVWTYVSWLSVLVGGKTAASHQQGETRARQQRWAQLDQASTEALALSIVRAVAEPFVAGEPPRISRRALSERFGAPLSVVRRVVDRLVSADLLISAGEDPERPLTLARAPEQVRILDVLRVFRGKLSELESLPFRPAPPAVEVIRSLEETLACSDDNLSVAELLERR